MAVAGAGSGGLLAARVTAAPRGWLSLGLPCPCPHVQAQLLLASAVDEGRAGTWKQTHQPWLPAPFLAVLRGQHFTVLTPKRGVMMFLGGTCRHQARWSVWLQGGTQRASGASPSCSPFGCMFRSETTSQYEAALPTGRTVLKCTVSRPVAASPLNRSQFGDLGKKSCSVPGQRMPSP